MRLLLASAIVLTAGCGEFTDGGANDPRDDEAAAIEAAAEAARETDDTELDADVARGVRGMCAALSFEDSVNAMAGLENQGTIGPWTVYGDRNLACMEPGPDLVTECELSPGGVAVLESPPDVIGFRNDTGDLVAAMIGADGVSCEIKDLTD